MSAAKREFAEETEVPAKVSMLEEGRIARNIKDNTDEGPGEFEDAFEDEMSSSSEEDVIEENEMDIDDDDDEEEEEGEEAQKVKVYLPGQKLGPDEVLEPDATAYIMLHQVSMNWPSLSFDFIPDALGQDRSSFPHTLYLAAGTQADKAKNNEITVVKFSQLHRTNVDVNDSEDEDNNDDDELDDDPLLEHHSISHQGGVNRLRVAANEDSLLAASWADTGKVYIWDLRPSMNFLGHSKPAPKTTKPIFTVLGHKHNEGYAMDWSVTEFGKLLSGDTNGCIYLTTPQQSSFKTDTLAFTSHQGSVEDIQWSPTESTVFASCSVDGNVKIWDTRTKRQSSALTFKAHSVDVNVISWNRKVDYLLASGSDDGNLSIWDMRMLLSNQNSASPVANFKWHAEAITSLEWHPQEESVLAASGADNQLTIWDLSVEADPEEERMQDDVQIPPQLLFIHMGQEDIKELHWHRQIPGCMVSTALNGFNIMKTISA